MSLAFPFTAALRIIGIKLTGIIRFNPVLIADKLLKRIIEYIAFDIYAFPAVKKVIIIHCYAYHGKITSGSLASGLYAVNMICRASYKICLCRYSTPVSGTVLSCRTDNCAFIHGVIRWSVYTAYKTVILGIIAEISAEQCRRYSRNDIGIPASVCHFNLSVIFY